MYRDCGQCPYWGGCGICDHPELPNLAKAKPMRIYLAGPMRGYKEFNFPAFHAAAAKLRADGHEVFNPAERDIERHGTDISAGNETGSVLQAQVAHGFNLRVALGEDLAWICRHADAVYLLPNWRNSKGATAERAVALALGLFVVELPEEKAVDHAFDVVA